MSSQQYPHDPYGGDQQGNVWEQSQPTGNVWDPQATDAWGQQAVSNASPQGLPPSPSPSGPMGQSAPPPQQQPPQVPPSPNNFFTALFDFGFKHRLSAAAIKTVYLLGTITAALLAVAILAMGFTSQNPLLIVVSLFLAPAGFFTTLAAVRVIMETYRAVAGESD